MGLLRKALIYREKYLKEHGLLQGSGLLSKTLKYLGFKKSKKSINLNNDNEITDNLKYYNILNYLSKDMLKISFGKNSKKELNDIISKHYNFKKNIFFIYSPIKQKFTYWTGKNIIDKSTEELSFDLKFGNIFKKIIKNNSLLITRKDKDFSILSDILSVKDRDDCSFLLFVPFIFFGHIIGIFTGLKMSDNSTPDNNLINSLELLGRFNGALLYNIYQQENIDKQE